MVVTPGPVSAAASTASGYAIAGSFAEGQELLDEQLRALYANSQVQVCATLACAGLLNCLTMRKQYLFPHPTRTQALRTQASVLRLAPKTRQLAHATRVYARCR